MQGLWRSLQPTVRITNTALQTDYTCSNTNKSSATAVLMFYDSKRNDFLLTECSENELRNLRDYTQKEISIAKVPRKQTGQGIAIMKTGLI